MTIQTTAQAGIAYLAIDGKNHLLVGDLNYSLSTIERATLMGMDGYHGFSGKPIAAFIAATLRDSSNLSASKISAMENVTVTLELVNGKVIVGRNMTVIGAQEIEGSEAKITVRWEGPSVVEA